MRQRFLNSAGFGRGQPSQHILEVRIGVVPCHARRLDQAHDPAKLTLGAPYAAKLNSRFVATCVSFPVNVD